MRLTTATCLCLALALATTAGAARTKGAGGGKSGDNTITGNAQDGYPTGTADKGQFLFNDTQNNQKVSYSSSLDCARVDGNTTYFSGVIKLASRYARNVLGIIPGVTYIYGELVDNAEPNNYDDYYELRIVQPGELQEDPATYCETDQVGTSGYTIDNGNLQTIQ